MASTSIAGALLLSLDNTDSEREFNNGSGSIDFFPEEEDYEHVDDELTTPITDLDTTFDDSNDTDEVDLSTDADDASVIEIDVDDNNHLNINNHSNSEESSEELAPPVKRFKSVDNQESEESESVDASQKCPICLGAWTSVGEHRLCSLRCGHLFGYKCIEHWLNSTNRSNRRCPQCNTKASVKHIRFLYANKLTSPDYSEIERFKKKLDKISIKNKELSKALIKQKRRTKKYKQMYKARTMALTLDSDFCISD